MTKVIHKIRSIRVSDKNWEEFKKFKIRGISWNKLIEKINKKYE